MKYEELKNRGVKIAEFDKNDGGIYLGTDEDYVVDGDWYQHIYNDNSLSYRGKENETVYCGTLKFMEEEYLSKYEAVKDSEFVGDDYKNALRNGIARIQPLTKREGLKW